MRHPNIDGAVKALGFTKCEGCYGWFDDDDVRIEEYENDPHPTLDVDKMDFCRNRVLCEGCVEMIEYDRVMDSVPEQVLIDNGYQKCDNCQGWHLEANLKRVDGYGKLCGYCTDVLT